MTKLLGAEVGMVGHGTYVKYMELARAATELGKQDQIDQLRYSLAMSHYATEEGQGDNLMFIGGLGVLGNIVGKLGVSSISKWRGTRDIDVALRDKASIHLVENSFDVLDVSSKSLSIPNKMTIRGYSTDADNHQLRAATVDAYVPGGKPSQGIYINGLTLLPIHWAESRRADFFGINMNCLDPMTLLGMKLDVDTSLKQPRKQDLEDIAHLFGILESEDTSKKDFRLLLGEKRMSRLKAVLGVVDNYNMNRTLLIKPSNKYRSKILT
ncbi:MAG: hypothetical protein Q7R87_00815 [Nanoarchaeota archaeon]|nr:hypothetical protein [Nanoarchaeota archaeon]